MVPPRTNARGADLLSDSLASPNDCTNSSYTFAASASALCGACGAQSGGGSAFGCTVRHAVLQNTRSTEGDETSNRALDVQGASRVGSNAKVQ